MPTATAERRVTRPYRSVVRAEQARRTRGRVLEVAHRLFVERGYPATSMRAVAAAADVAVPTVELLFGTKPRLLTAVIDVAIAGDDEAVGSWTATGRSGPGRRRRRANCSAWRRVRWRRPGALRRRSPRCVRGGDQRPGGGAVVDDQEERRAVTARWLVDGVVARTPLRPGATLDDATESVWA